VTGDATIADMWKDSFEKLYSRYDNKGLTGEFVSVTSEDYHLIKVDDVRNEIHKLKCHKSIGPDGIPAEAIKHAGHLLAVHWTLLYNMCLCHCYLPGELIQTTIV